MAIQPNFKETQCIPEKTKPYEAILIIISIWLCFFFTSVLTDLDFNRWDNFEYHTSVIIAAHSQWLNGTIPFWNHYQHLGEPLLANAQPGVLYFPYTLILWVMRFFHIADKHFCLIVALTHYPLMGVGYFSFLRFLGIRPYVAYLGTLGILTASCLTVFVSMWIFLCPIFSWLPWALLGLLRFLMRQEEIKGLLLLVFSLTLIGFVNHPQFVIYLWILLILFAVSITCFRLVTWRNLFRLIIPLSSAVLLSAPAILPVYSILPFTSRNTPLALSHFLEWTVPPEALLGMLNPLFFIDNGFFLKKSPNFFYQGAWVAPALFTPFLLFWQKKKNENQIDSPVALTAIYKTFLVIALIFILFSLGDAGIIYPMTFGIPIWSSFRWPIKFVPYAVIAIGCAGTIGMELYMRNSKFFSQNIRLMLCVFFLSLFIVPFAFTGSITLFSPVGFLNFIAGILIIPCFFWHDKKYILIALISLGFISATAANSLTHSFDLKSYKEEYASVGVGELGINTDFRILPLSDEPWPWVNPMMQELSIFHSATANQYYSLTGHTTAMAPLWYLRLINSSVDGTIPKNVYPLFLQSHFIKTLNVRFFNVDKNDKDVVNLLLKSKDYKKIKELQRVFIFENDKALPRAYFAKKSIPFTMRNFKKGLFQNKESIKTIFVEGEKLTREWQSSEVISSEWPDEGKVFVKVDSPNGGFLVISQTYYPQWKAYVDGVETRIHRVNGLIQGIKIPPGGKYIKLAWHSTALTQGFIVAMAGLLLMFAGIYYLKRTK